MRNEFIIFNVDFFLSLSLLLLLLLMISRLCNMSVCISLKLFFLIHFVFLTGSHRLFQMFGLDILAECIVAHFGEFVDIEHIISLKLLSM